MCEDQKCEDQVLPLAVNLMDRFLCVCTIKKQQLQLLGATCLLIASKTRSTISLPVKILCAYTDYSVSHDNIVVSIVQWFYDIFLYFENTERSYGKLLKVHCVSSKGRKGHFRIK